MLVGSAFLLFAGGINGLILPLRGAQEGFSALSLGLLGTGWAVGYISGCLMVPRLVGNVGHIRGFSAMAGLAAISILMSLLLINASAWIVLRALAGFCFAGAAMIVESWLTERTEASQRGKVFGIYTMVNLSASTAGQLALTLGESSGFEYFVIGAIFYALALLPTAMTRQLAPRPMRAVKLDIRSLWRNSPLAVAGVALVGVSNSAFGTLGAVYGAGIGLDITTIALFMSFALIAGALFQIPLGVLSDRMDRRFVLLALAAMAAAVDVSFIVVEPDSRLVLLILVSAFGTAIYGMYPVIVAHANDLAPPGDFIRTSGGLLLVFGFGSIVGPLFAGATMGLAGPQGLFITSVAAHLSLIAFGLFRIRQRNAPEPDEKASFRPAPFAGTSTPQTAIFEGEESLTPVVESATQ